jgi:methyl-accepting chemotaxis protein
LAYNAIANIKNIGNIMNNISVRTRLFALVLGMAALLVVVGGMGFYTTGSAIHDLQDTYEQQTIPMREVARLRRLIVENESHVFRAFQHNPAFDYAKLHDHAVTAHTDNIEKNIKWADETWKDLFLHLDPASQETKLAKEIQPIYENFVNEVLRPVVARLKAGDFTTESVATFLKDNASYGAKMNQSFRDLAEAQQNAVKEHYETSLASSTRLRNLSIAIMVAGSALALLLAFLTIRSVVGPLNEMRTVIDRAASQNDFTGSINVAGHNEIADTAQAFNTMMATLRTSLTDLKQNMISVDDALMTLATSSDQAARASMSTSESASAMAASVEEMSVSITSVSDSTNEALNISEAAGRSAETGGKVIDNTVVEIEAIAQVIGEVSTTIKALGDSSDRISSVVQVIRDVADQTNLLALNAAIEAARAGEAGRGFAVVADEVRKLAERTSTATGEIASMIDNIQSCSRSAVDNMEHTVTQVGRGTQHAQEAGQAIVSIREGSAQVVRVVHDIADAMSEQGAASQDIARRVENVAQASEESSASVQQAANAVRNIRETSARMRATAERFKV